MADSKNSILLLDDGSGREVECYYRTSTENIIDFVQAVNNLIHTSQSDTVFTGTTTFENIHVTGTSELDGEITSSSRAIIDNDIVISKGSIASLRDDVLIKTNSGSYIKINKQGGWEICSKYAEEEIQTLLSVDQETKELKYSNNAVFEKDINILGSINSPVVKLPYTTISSDHLTTTISTPSGGNIKIANGDGAIQLITKTGKILKVDDDGKAYINGNQLLTKTEMMQLEHPIGSVYFTLTDTNPSTILGVGTWQKIGTGYKLGIVGSVKDKNGTAHNTVAGNNTDGEWTHANSVAELPAHNHGVSCAANGAHTHTRGTMNITGTSPSSTEFYRGSITGAFYSIASYATVGGHDWPVFGIGFDASRSWSGATSSNGSHGHTITIGNTGSGSRHNNIEPAFGIYLWKRTA